MNLKNFFFILAAVLGALAVALGAASTHIIKPLAPDLFATANTYHFLHAIVLLILAAMKGKFNARRALPSGFLLAGILLFSGSLYLRASGLAQSSPLAPAGGLCLIAGWLLLAIMNAGRKR